MRPLFVFVGLSCQNFSRNSSDKDVARVDQSVVVCQLQSIDYYSPHLNYLLPIKLLPFISLSLALSSVSAWLPWVRYPGPVIGSAYFVAQQWWNNDFRFFQIQFAFLRQVSDFSVDVPNHLRGIDRTVFFLPKTHGMFRTKASTFLRNAFGHSEYRCCSRIDMLTSEIVYSRRSHSKSKEEPLFGGGFRARWIQKRQRKDQVADPQRGLLQV